LCAIKIDAIAFTPKKRAHERSDVMLRDLIVNPPATVYAVSIAKRLETHIT